MYPVSILPCRRNNYTKWKFFDLTSDRHYFKWVPFPQQCKLSLVVSVTVYHFTKHDLEEIWGSQLALLLFLPICIWSENRDYFADPWTGFSEFQHIHICDCLRLAGDFPWRENQFLLSGSKPTGLFTTCCPLGETFKKLQMQFLDYEFKLFVWLVNNRGLTL